MQLYRIEYDQLTLVSFFDDCGVKLHDGEERIRVAINDLPLPTAIMYRERMEGLNFVMTAQPQGYDERPRNHRAPKRSTSREVATVSKPAPRRQTVQEAAQAGDMSAAINMRSE